MSIKNLLITYGLVASGIFSACRLGHNDHNMSIRVINTDDRYQFEASYDSHKTRAIERYITSRIKPSDVLNSNDHRNNLTVIMADETTFRIKSYPGELKIEMDKKRNSKKACDEVTDICRGIRELLGKKS